MDKNNKIAQEILDAVGGEDNISFVSHCITRLRFNLKDQSIPKDETIKEIDGVIGVAKSAGQYHVIVGQNVSKVYEEFIKLSNFKTDDIVVEVKEEKSWSLKGMLLEVLDVLGGSVTPLIPVMLSAAMFKVFVALLGPDMLNVLASDSNIMALFAFVGDAGFYFLPIYLGYTSARKIGTSQVLGMFLGAILIHPSFMAMIGTDVQFTVFGLPAPVQNYTASLIPIVLSVWILKYVEKFMTKIIPELLRTVFVPFLSTLIMLPVMFVITGPIGGIIGNGLSNLLLGLGDVPFIGVFAVALIGGLWQLLVITGMHQVLITSMIVVFSTHGVEAVVLPGATVASIAVSGMLFGALLRIKNKKEKSLTLGYLVASFIGGVTEPGLYGNAIKFKRPFIGLFIGGFVGGLYASILGVKSYALVPVASFLALTGFAGGHPGNFLHGIIASVIAFIVAAVITYFFGFNKNEPVIQE